MVNYLAYLTKALSHDCQGEGHIRQGLCSLACRSNGFITMLAPIRDHPSPKDPASAPPLCSTKERYFSRLPVRVEPGKPGLEEASDGTAEPAEPLVYLSQFSLSNNQLDADEEAISRAIDIFSERGEQSLVCGRQRLGVIYQLKGEIEKAITIAGWPSEPHPFSTNSIYWL